MSLFSLQRYYLLVYSIAVEKTIFAAYYILWDFFFNSMAPITRETFIFTMVHLFCWRSCVRRWHRGKTTTDNRLQKSSVYCCTAQKPVGNSEKHRRRRIILCIQSKGTKYWLKKSTFDCIVAGNQHTEKKGRVPSLNVSSDITLASVVWGVAVDLSYLIG